MEYFVVLDDLFEELCEDLVEVWGVFEVDVLVKDGVFEFMVI